MKLISFTKKYIGELSVLLGTGLFTNKVLAFSYSDSTRGGGLPVGLPKLPGLERELGNVAYYYKDETLLLISLGAMLVVGGLFIIRNRNLN